MSEVVQHVQPAPLATKQELREGIEEFMHQVKEQDIQIETLDCMHHFTNQVYARTVLMKMGDVIVGKIHKHEHLVIVSAGRCRVVSEEFGSMEIVAPQIFKSPPGVRRALHILEDTVWTTIHRNPDNEHDVKKLEERFVSTDYKFEDEVKS